MGLDDEEMPGLQRLTKGKKDTPSISIHGTNSEGGGRKEGGEGGGRKERRKGGGRKEGSPFCL